MSSTTEPILSQPLDQAVGDIPPPPNQRGLLYLDSLRARLRDAGRLPSSIPFAKFTSTKQLQSQIPDEQLQGMMICFNFLFPLPHESPENAVKILPPESTLPTLELLSDFRDIIRVRMTPDAQALFLSKKYFEDASSSYQLERMMGDERVEGALQIFCYFHGIEVRPVIASPVSFNVDLNATDDATTLTPVTNSSSSSLSAATTPTRTPTRGPPARLRARTPNTSARRQLIPSSSLMQPSTPAALVGLTS